MPADWILAPVKTGDDGERIIRLDDEHEAVGKVPEPGAADTLVYGGELLRVGPHALDDCLDL